MITNLFKVHYPIVQGGMIWASGAKLAAAVSNAGGLGLIGAGSMTPEIFEAQLDKAMRTTNKPFGVNVPLLYPHSAAIIEKALRKNIGIFFTSAGNPAPTTALLKKENRIVVHVVSSPRLAKKCEDCGCDAVVAEGFEAGGHNGRDELSTMTLIPQVVDSVKIPVIAAGGIADGRTMAAAIALGAEGVQIGTRFAASNESSLHDNFKQAIVAAKPEDTILILKKLVPVRCLKNDFVTRVIEEEKRGATKEELSALLGRGRSRRGMFEGDLVEGELEIGQICGMIDEIKPVAAIIEEIITEYRRTIESLGALHP